MTNLHGSLVSFLKVVLKSYGKSYYRILRVNLFGCIQEIIKDINSLNKNEFNIKQILMGYSDCNTLNDKIAATPSSLVALISMNYDIDLAVQQVKLWEKQRQDEYMAKKKFVETFWKN